MKNAILVTVVAALIAIGGVTAYFVLHEEEKVVNYRIDGYCYEEGIGTFTITLDNYKGEITEGSFHGGKGTLSIPVHFVDGVGTFTVPSVHYFPGPIGMGTNTTLEIPGFTTHRIL